MVFKILIFTLSGAYILVGAALHSIHGDESIPFINIKTYRNLLHFILFIPFAPVFYLIKVIDKIDDFLDNDIF